MKNNNTATKSFSEFKNQKELLIKITKDYANGFEEKNMLSFNLSPEQIKKLTFDFFEFSSLIINIQEKMSDIVFNLSELLISAYDQNDIPTIKIFDSYIRCFSDIEQYINEFTENCSIHLKNKNTLHANLHKAAITLIKKIEALPSLYPELQL